MTRSRLARVVGPAACVVVMISTGFATAPTSAATNRPNILIIMTDDQRWDTVTSRFMPNVVRALVNEGTLFANAFAPNPLCCPSRTSTLTGLYSHQTGVYGNEMPYGGYESFDPTTTIATVLQQTGYRTALIGKYLNQYPAQHFTEEPPGWNRWVAIGTGQYYDYRLAIDGKRSAAYGSAPADYSGRVLTRMAVAFVDRAIAAQQPFFLFYAPTAPHRPATPDPRDVGRFAGIERWRPANYGPNGVSASSPRYVRDSASAWNAQTEASIDAFRQRQVEAIYGVDRNVGTILAHTPANTLVLFMSDNGFMWGEHARGDKRVPYDESIRIPLVMRLPNQTQGASNDSRLALNIDLVPTILEAAGLPPDTLTGMDAYQTDAHVAAAPLGTSLAAPSARTEFVLEHYDAGDPVPTYCGVRTVHHVYVMYATGEQELYDAAADPLEMTNLVPSEVFSTTTLRAEAESLCAPAPPGFAWPSP